MATMFLLLTWSVFEITSGSKLNLALRKPTSASSMQSGYSASTAVDGNTVANSGSTSKIILTRTSQSYAWWRVDLQREVQDATVRIYFRTDYTMRRNGVTLYTSTSPISGPSGQLCHTVRGAAHGRNINSTYSVTCPGRWSYLLLYTSTRNDGLTGPVLDFGEVEVFGEACSPGVSYGVNCGKSCSARHCVTSPLICDPQTGQCPEGCEPGWTGVDCSSRCARGTYGANCSEPCGNCDGVCDNVDGRCLAECLEGYYGPYCSEKCDQCEGVCDNVDGRCLAGCLEGYYGPYCTEKCGYCDGVCDRVNGSCYVGCLDGYSGAWCNMTRTPDTNNNALVGAVVGTLLGTLLVVVLLVVGALIFLIRKGRLQWVEHPEDKESVQVSRDNTQMNSIPRTPADVYEHVNSSSHVHNNDYAALDSEQMPGNKDYDVIQHKEYENI